MDQIPETIVTANDDGNAYELEQCLDRLTDEDREIVKRRYYHDQKPAEIAKDMGMNKKKVENRLFRSKKKLKDMLNDLGAY